MTATISEPRWPRAGSSERGLPDSQLITEGFSHGRR
jgi:hypothetical protein